MQSAFFGNATLLLAPFCTPSGGLGNRRTTRHRGQVGTAEAPRALGLVGACDAFKGLMQSLAALRST
eukprot:201626-Lingulodinium_polyedra.AAC.1